MKRESQKPPHPLAPIHIIISSLFFFSIHDHRLLPYRCIMFDPSLRLTYESATNYPGMEKIK
jgi:hypothetical protein